MCSLFSHQIIVERILNNSFYHLFAQQTFIETPLFARLSARYWK